MTRTTGPALVAVLALVAAPAVGPNAASCQTARGVVLQGAEQLVREGDRLRESLKPAEALAAYERALDADAESYAALWRSAREAVSLGMLASSEEARKERYQQAESYARRAVKVAEDEPEGHHWLAVALGRRALSEGPRTRVRLAEEVREEALTVLELDSLHAGAHHVLGQWHAEAKRMGGVSRFLARHLLGGEVLDEASWGGAAKHLERAVELAPGGLIHQLELARVYLDLGREEDARARLREVLERPAAVPTDPLHKQEAVRLMGELSQGESGR